MPEFLSLEILTSPAVLAAPCAAIAGVLLGFLLGRRRRVQPAAIAQEETRDLRKTMALLQNENRNLSTFLMTLPDLARQLNANDEKRRVPQILTAFTEQLFDAEQVLIFLVAGGEGKNLTLAGGKGLPNLLRGQEVVPFGQGRIGWVAESQITMDESDFMAKTRTLRAEEAASLTNPFRTELAAPLVAKDQTLGVISLGGLLRRPKNEKNMLKMVADLGSISIHNTLMFNLIKNSANMDGLTGLANKRHFTDLLAHEIIKSEKEQRPMSLFLFDIDHFKTYNDTNGHLAGDEALKTTGRLIRQNVRQDDMAARYGGEEFAVILPNTDKQGALRLAEKLRRVVEGHEFPHEKSQPLGRVTISGGVATFPEDGKSTADLIRCADQALYQCKHAGRNRVLAHHTRDLFGDTSASLPGAPSDHGRA